MRKVLSGLDKTTMFASVSSEKTVFGDIMIWSSLSGFWGSSKRLDESTAVKGPCDGSTIVLFVEWELTESFRLFMLLTLISYLAASSLLLCSTVIFIALIFLLLSGAYSSSTFYMFAFTLARDKFCKFTRG